ncbi:hypothetical protein BGZ65_002631 [Modicella reniformis]|uniref:Uncharacterized protein n=1 Tax=Modicella reniformis TaxID=1440133 RepID=A0A9P6M9L6_9FUNG|nr:hypothetical protein BGZ65_002631 [Modicella reniformis]
MAILSHLPKNLQELELDIDMYYDDDHEQIHTTTTTTSTTTTTTSTTTTTTTTTPLQLTQPTALRRFVFCESLTNYEDIFLIPLLKGSPWLEDLNLSSVRESTFGEIVTALTKTCPRLQSFTHEFRNSDLLRNIITLMEVYPNGLRYLDLTSAWYYTVNSNSTDSDSGALVKALLRYSAKTIEVIKLRGQMRHWIKGITSVLEQCPNLKELHVYGDYLPLDDIVGQTTWKTRSIWESESTNKSSLLLPWVCKQLEALSLFIDKPQSASIDFSPQSYKQDQETNDMIEELALSTVLQVGVLWKTLKSLKSLKALSLNWDQPVYHTIGTMPFDRGVYYMDRIGLSGITQPELEWMGIQWEAIIDRLKTEEAGKLEQAALEDRSGYDSSYLDGPCTCNLHWEEDPEVDWPFNVDQKKFNKSGKLHSRRSLRSGADWFGTYAKK